MVVEAPQHRVNVHADVTASSEQLAELNRKLDEAWQRYENFLDLAEEEPELAQASLGAWEAAFAAYHSARVQRGNHWRQLICLEADLLSAGHASDMFLFSRGLGLSVGSTRAGIWALSDAERDTMTHFLAAHGTVMTA